MKQVHDGCHEASRGMNPRATRCRSCMPALELMACYEQLCMVVEHGLHNTRTLPKALHRRLVRMEL